MTAHSELLARLEGASEGSRELDAAIAVLTRWPALGSIPHWVHDEEMAVRPYGKIGFKNIPENPAEWSSPAVTTCVTAALALAERVLPGWMFAVAGPWTNTVVGRDFYCAEVVACTEASGVGYREVNELGNEAATPALALCIAVLRAQPQPDGEKT